MHRLRRSMSNCRFFVWALALAAAPLAANHESLLDEAMAGAFGRPDIQFVEMRFSFCDQNQWAGVRRLAFFDAAGNEVGEFVLPTNPRADCDVNGQSVLFGTRAFADLPSTPQPDFLIPPLLVPGSGKVCFESIPEGDVEQCLSYGDFTGDSEQGSADNAPGLSSLESCSLRRSGSRSFFGGINFNEDFVLATPAPRNGAGQSGTVVVPPRFADIPAGNPFRPFVEALFNAGITGGCGNGSFCPTALVSRAQMAVLLLRAAEGPAFQPPACVTPLFADVPCSSPFAPWINELAARGISDGCGGGDFCPDSPVTREQMAVFLLLAAAGPDFQPPACVTPVFGDVPCSSPFAPWIHELAARGITGGCAGGRFCPEGSVTREQMAVFLSTAFRLPVPVATCAPPPVQPPDDHGGLPENATPLAPGGAPVAGVIHQPSDLDLFSFPALAGEVFVIEANTLSMDTTLTLFAPDGTTVLGFDDDGGPGLSSRLVFIAPSPGTYFVAVESFGNFGTGSYEVVIHGPLADDHGDATAEATPVAPNGPPLDGTLEFPGDRDFFSFFATAGEAFHLLAEPTTTGSFPSIEVFGPGGGSLGGFQSDLVLVAPTTGLHFAGVGASFSESFGSYRLTVTGPIADDHGNIAATATPVAPGAPALAAQREFRNDRDFFSFFAQAGQTFLLKALGDEVGLAVLDTDGVSFLDSTDNSFDGVAATILFTAPRNGTFFARVTSAFFDTTGPYTVSITPVHDDHGNVLAAATLLVVGAPSVAGVFEISGDVDVFAFDAAIGQTLVIETSQLASGADTILEILDENGFVLAQDDDGGGGLASRITFSVPATDRFFARVRHFSFEGTGSYRVRVRTP